MPAINFKKQFSDRVEFGDKKQTIRRKRKRPIKLGDKLYLYTGMRTSCCRKLRSTRCDDVLPIFIDSNKSVILGNKLLTDQEKHDLALDDGFKDFAGLFDFFRSTCGLPLAGQLIKWL